MPDDMTLQAIVMGEPEWTPSADRVAVHHKIENVLRRSAEIEAAHVRVEVIVSKIMS